MNYRCPKCSQRLNIRNLVFHDITACPNCAQKVVLGDFLAFFMAAITMAVVTLATLYVLSQEFEEYLVAAGYAVSIGMIAGIAVLLVLGRATPFRRVRIVRRPQHGGEARAEPTPKT